MTGSGSGRVRAGGIEASRPESRLCSSVIWCEIVALACELLAWMPMLAFTGSARIWEPKRLRLRIFAVAGRLVRGAAACGCA